MFMSVTVCCLLPRDWGRRSCGKATLYLPAPPEPHWPSCRSGWKQNPRPASVLRGFLHKETYFFVLFVPHEKWTCLTIPERKVYLAFQTSLFSGGYIYVSTSWWPSGSFIQIVNQNGVLVWLVSSGETASPEEYVHLSLPQKNGAGWESSRPLVERWGVCDHPLLIE